jgi:hypothetical protein
MNGLISSTCTAALHRREKWVTSKVSKELSIATYTSVSLQTRF